MPSSCTILEHLSRPNPKLHYDIGSAAGSLTVNERWLPIEGVRLWDDFTFDTLYPKYKSELSKVILAYDPNQHIKHARLNEIVNEDTVTALVTVNNILPVNNALYDAKTGLHYGPGSKFFKRQSDGSPDWGLGFDGVKNDDINTLRNFCPGDLKTYSKWNAGGLLDENWIRYQDDPALLNRARPLEQVQHYGLSLGTRYAWILTDAELVVIRITTSTDEPRSPRQLRQSPHQRVVSDASNISQAFSTMSIDNSAYSGGSSSGINPASLEIMRIPWWAGLQPSKKKGKEMTINLALYFLARLASEGCSISTSYPPIDAKSKTPRPRNPLPSAQEVGQRYWIPAKGISWDVIHACIDKYIPGATVAKYEKEGLPGYLVSTTMTEQEEVAMMISDLKSDTLIWEEQGGEYLKSEIYRSRMHHGGSYKQPK